MVEPQMRYKSFSSDRRSQVGTLLETIQLPRGLKTYIMTVRQGLRNSGIEVWCNYADYKFLMPKKLTKLSLLFPGTLVLNSFLMPFAATPAYLQENE